FVDFTVSLLVLDFPHPLFSDDVDLERVPGRHFFVKINLGAPAKKSHRDQNRNGRPGDFNQVDAQSRFGPVGRLAATISKKEYQHRQEYQRQNGNGESQQDKEQVVRLDGDRRSRFRKSRDGHGRLPGLRRGKVTNRAPNARTVTPLVIRTAAMTAFPYLLGLYWKQSNGTDCDDVSVFPAAA